VAHDVEVLGHGVKLDIGLAEMARRNAEAGGEQGIEAGGLDQLGAERVIGAGRPDRLPGGEAFAEPFALFYDVSPLCPFRRFASEP
jgi:hypothetical protein